MRLRTLLLTIICLFLSLIVQAQFEADGLEQLTREDGLGHNQVECIYQDSHGFMWFGTRNGLSRYDGFEFKTFRNSADSTSISGNRILSIAEDPEGNLWIGTFQNGLNKYLREEGIFKRYPMDGIAGTRINKVAILSDESIWLCTDYGLARLKKGSLEFDVFHADNTKNSALNSNQVFDILESSSGDIYIATWSYSIQRVDPDAGTFTDVYYERSPQLTIDYRKRIIEDSEGNLWISANQHGLCRLNPETGESHLYTSENSGLQTDVLNGDMLMDQNGLLWISTDGRGVNVFDVFNNKFYYLNDSQEADMYLPGNQVYSIYKDNQNHIWIGFYDKGVVHYAPEAIKFKHSLFQEDDLEALRGSSVLSLFQDSHENIWIGTDGDGLYSFNENEGLKIFRHDPGNSSSLSSNVITSIGEDASGKLLVGTYAAGFNIYHSTTGTWERIQQGYDENHVNSSSVWEILTDSRGRTWLGLLGNGLDLYSSENGTFENFGESSGQLNRVNHSNIMVILEDTDGDIWFGTEGNGVNIFDQQSGKMTEPGLSQEDMLLQHSMIRCLYQDRKARIWIGTEGEGLFIYNKRSGELEQLTLEQGLSDMIVQGIHEDNRGSFWITTGNGLSMYNPVSEQWKHFFRSDGLMANEFNSDAILQLNDGRILVGSINGIDLIDPESMVFNQNIPRVVLTKLEILHQEIEPGDLVNGREVLDRQITFTDEIMLRHADKIFAIEFAALNYIHSEKCEFRYLLEGFDEQWVYTSSNMRVAKYSNLKPGTYTFKVEASNNDGKWGYNTRELVIDVKAPYWASWWFIAILVQVAGLIIFYIYKTQLNAYKNTFQRQQAMQEKRIVELEKENLELELKKLTFFRLNRNRNLLEMKNRLAGISVKARENVKSGLENVIGEIDHEISADKDWKLIEPQLDITYNNFLTKLKEKHGDLNLSELKIAAYIRMNLSTKEIAEYMHKTVRAIENDRYRLRKKLDLGPSDSLSQYLSSL